VWAIDRSTTPSFVGFAAMWAVGISAAFLVERLVQHYILKTPRMTDRLPLTTEGAQALLSHLQNTGQVHKDPSDSGQA